MSDDFEIGKAVKNLHNLTKVGEPVASLQATRLYSDKPNTPCEAGMCQHCEGNGCRCTCHVSAAQPAAGTTLEWTAEEIENFHKQASQPQPEPSEHLIRAMSEGTTPQAERQATTSVCRRRNFLETNNVIATKAIQVFKETRGKHEGAHIFDGSSCSRCEESYIAAEAELDSVLESVAPVETPQKCLDLWHKEKGCNAALLKCPTCGLSTV